MGKNYVLHSTPESREQHITSLLAIFETIFFVLLTWGIAYHYDTYTHIYTAIAIAPFLLLKTPRSIKKAIELFLYESKTDNKNSYKKISSWIIAFFSSILFYIAIYLFSTKILIHYHKWELFLLSVILGTILPGTISIIMVGVLGKDTETIEGGATITKILLIIIAGALAAAGVSETKALIGVVIGIAISIVGVIKEENYSKLIQTITFPFYLILIVGASFGFFLRSIIIKFFTTLFNTIMHPIETFSNISKNWSEQIAINDIFYTPELLPEINKKDQRFQLSGTLHGIKEDDLVDQIIKITIASIWSLGYLYRFSIKSTAWFFFPLAYLANLNALHNEDKKQKTMKTQTWKKLFWFNMIVSAVLLLYFNYTGQYIELLGLSKAKLAFITEIMATVRQYFIKDAMWLLVVAVILYFIMNTIVSKKEHLKDDNYSIFCYWIIKLIFVLWMVFLGWHLVVLTNHFVFPELVKLF